jgi:fibronectin type 3 domain-containing protein
VIANDVHYALLDATGGVVVAPIRVSFTADQAKESLALSWNGDGVGIAYANRLLTDPPGLVIRFTVTGLDGIKQFSETTVSEGVFDNQLQALYWAGDRFRIAFNSPVSSTLREVDVSTSGTLLGASRLLSNRAGNSSLAWNGATTALVWTQTSELWFETTACLADVTAPACPTVTSSRDASGVDLSWPAVSDAESGVYRYFIYRDGTLLHETAATSFEDVGVRPGDQGTYRVSASNGAFLESQGCSSFTLIGIPSGLVASYSSQVDLTWQGVTGATSYRIERSSSGNSFTQVGTSSTPAYTDGAAAAQTAYLYRVFALSGPQTSGPTNSDLVTTMTFADDPLVTGGPVKALHHSQLRQAVAAVRTLAQLGSATYTYTPAAGGTIRAADITELRAALTQALTALSLPVPTFTDTVTAGVPIKRVHVQQLRDAVK